MSEKYAVWCRRVGRLRWNLYSCYYHSMDTCISVSNELSENFIDFEFAVVPRMAGSEIPSWEDIIVFSSKTDSGV